MELRIGLNCIIASVLLGLFKKMVFLKYLAKIWKIYLGKNYPLH